MVISEERVHSGMLCLLNFSSQRTSVRLPTVCGPYWTGMTHSWRTVWDPGGVGTPRRILCGDCLCLIALFQNLLPCDRGQSWLPTMFLKDIGCWRTIDSELAYSGRVNSPCNNTLSSRLDVWQIKGWWTDTMIDWGMDALFLWCVGVYRAAVGVVTPVGVTIQVTGLSSLGGGFTGRSVWLSQVMRWAWLWCRQISVRGLTVVCPGGLGIEYKCRAVARELFNSLCASDLVTSLQRSCMSPYRYSCSDCIRLAVCVFLQRVWIL